MIARSADVLVRWSANLSFAMKIPQGGSVMRNLTAPLILTFSILIISSFVPAVAAQNSITVLAGADLTRVIPPGFYYQGLSAATQMRNAAAARLADKRYVITGLVDTSGYAADVRAKYEGFFITDSPIRINGSDLAVGAYGFGFSNDGKMQILDLAANTVLSVATAKDNEVKRPRPLMMAKAADGVRLYSGKDYVTISAK